MLLVEQRAREGLVASGNMYDANGEPSIFSIQMAEKRYQTYELVATNPGDYALYLSMVLFGLTAFSIPAIIAATISDLLPPSEAGKVFGYVTLFFGVGQIGGPSIAGFLAEQSGSFSSGYLLAGFLTALGILLTTALKFDKSQHA